MKHWQADNRQKNQVKKKVQILIYSIWGNDRNPKVGLS